MMSFTCADSKISNSAHLQDRLHKLFSFFFWTQGTSRIWAATSLHLEYANKEKSRC